MADASSSINYGTVDISGGGGDGGGGSVFSSTLLSRLSALSNTLTKTVSSGTSNSFTGYPSSYNGTSASHSTSQQYPFSSSFFAPPSSSLYKPLTFICGLLILAFLVRKKISKMKEVVLNRATALASRNMNRTPSAVESSEDIGTSKVPDIVGASSSTPAVSVLQRSALNHLQILGLLGRFNFKWPQSVKSFFHVSEGASSLSVTSNLQMVSLDESIKCGLYLGDVPLPMNEMIVDAIALLITVVVVLIFWGIRMWYKKQDPKKVMNKILISLITLFYLAYSKILRDLFQLFDCSQVGTLLP